MRPPGAPRQLLLALRAPRGPRPVIPRGRAERPSTCRSRRTRRIPLERLPREEAEALVGVLLGRAELGDRVDAAAPRGGGRGASLFLDALVRHRLARSGDERPVRLDEAIWSRVERLGAASQRLVELVAVAGAPLALDHAARVTATSADEVVRALVPAQVRAPRAAHGRRGRGGRRAVPRSRARDGAGAPRRGRRPRLAREDRDRARGVGARRAGDARRPLARGRRARARGGVRRTGLRGGLRARSPSTGPRASTSSRSTCAATRASEGTTARSRSASPTRSIAPAARRRRRGCTSPRRRARRGDEAVALTRHAAGCFPARRPRGRGPSRCSPARSPPSASGTRGARPAALADITLTRAATRLPRPRLRPPPGGRDRPARPRPRRRLLGGVPRGSASWTRSARRCSSPATSAWRSRAGEPGRLSRALAFESIVIVTRGEPAHDRARALIARAEEASRRTSDPLSLGMLAAARGATL